MVLLFKFVAYVTHVNRKKVTSEML